MNASYVAELMDNGGVSITITYQVSATISVSPHLYLLPNTQLSNSIILHSVPQFATKNFL